MSIARRLLRLEQQAGPAECPGEFDLQIVCVEEGTKPKIPDSICRKCGPPASQHSPSAQAGRIVQIVQGVDEAEYMTSISTARLSTRREHPITASVLLRICACARRRHRLNQWSYLRDLLDQLANRSTNADVSDLLPDGWAICHAQIN
jgi:hypothetical protein